LFLFVILITDRDTIFSM